MKPWGFIGFISFAAHGKPRHRTQTGIILKLQLPVDMDRLYYIPSTILPRYLQVV